jgi:ribosomal protein L37E
MCNEPEVEVLLPVDGFFPRQNPNGHNISDTGKCTTGVCHICGKNEFSWVTIQLCPSCGYFVDLWQHRNKEVEDIFQQYGQDKIKREYTEAYVKALLKKLGLGSDDYSITIQNSVTFSPLG